MSPRFKKTHNFLKFSPGSHPKMAKSRSLATNLAKIFDGSKDIVYVVQREDIEPPYQKPSQTQKPNQTSHRLKVAYANDQCLRWLEMDFMTLKETPLIFYSAKLENADANRIRGLAIPLPSPYLQSNPDPLSNDPSEGEAPKTFLTNVFVQHHTTGKFEYRLAQVIPLSRPNQAKNNSDYWLVIANAAWQNEPYQLAHTAEHVFLGHWHAELAKSLDQYQSRHALTHWIGASPAANTILSTAQLCIEAKRLNVQIFGPAGAGKEHLARTILNERQQLDKNLEATFYSCATSSPQQMQDAIRHLKKGNRGNELLVLLHVDQLEPASRQELEGFFQIPGFHLNTISTSTTELQSISGFPKSLAQRLGPIQLELPPLCDRPEDIPLLAQAILESQNLTATKQVSAIDEPTVQLLMEYHWPQNLDQLSAVLYSAHENTSHDILSVGDLPEFLAEEIKAAKLPVQQTPSIQLTDYLESIEAELIQRAMQQANGNKAKASRLLGISRPRLLRRLKQLDLVQWLESDSDDANNDFLDASDFKEDA